MICVSESPVNSSPKITAKVTDAVEVKEVTLFHKLASDGSFTKVDMVKDAAPDEYSADIPALDTLGVVEYYIEAVDTSSNSRTSPAQGANQPPMHPCRPEQIGASRTHGRDMLVPQV